MKIKEIYDILKETSSAGTTSSVGIASIPNSIFSGSSIKRMSSNMSKNPLSKQPKTKKKSTK